jgi:hypothetical protein
VKLFRHGRVRRSTLTSTAYAGCWPTLTKIHHRIWQRLPIDVDPLAVDVGRFCHEVARADTALGRGLREKR